MSKIYSYVIPVDDGAAPNPFWGTCTLAICKPAIRRNAEIGDWVVGTGSKNAKCNDRNVYDLSDSVVYAMKVSYIKTLENYDRYCRASLKEKIPNWRTNDWRLRMGDCIYDYSKGDFPVLRRGVHNEGNIKRDLSGENVLLSNDFYYFGEEARKLPSELTQIIKSNQGHKKIENTDLILKFEEWISRFEKNKIYSDPQMRFIFDRDVTQEIVSNCAKQRCMEDEIETEEKIC